MLQVYAPWQNWNPCSCWLHQPAGTWEAKNACLTAGSVMYGVGCIQLQYRKLAVRPYSCSESCSTSDFIVSNCVKSVIVNPPMMRRVLT